MMQGLFKTPTHWEQGSRTLVPPCQSLQLCPLGELQGNASSQGPAETLPPKKGTPKQPGLQNYKYLFCTCAPKFTIVPGYNRAHCACAVRLSFGHRTGKKDPKEPRKKNFDLQ